MGFKKAGSKKVKKVKKAPGKKGRKDGWDLEGGQFTEDTKDHVSSDDLKREKRAPRKTQERDEYIRRGRAKIEERKKKYQLEKRMSKKISFSDVLSEDDEEIVEEVKYQPKVVKRSRSCEKSSKSIMERLQGYVKKNLLRSDEAREELNDDDEEMVEDEISGDEEEEVVEEDYEMDEEEYNDMNSEDDMESETDDIVKEDIIDDEVDDANSDSDVEEEKVSREDKQDDFDWFFNPVEDQSSTQLMKKNISTEKNKSRNEIVKLSAFDNFQIYGGLHPTLKNHQRSPIECLKGVHGLHKMWRDRDQQAITSNLSKQILPYLGCYTDIMIEGRDHNNDRDMLSAVLLHSCNHVVRARSRVLKHNQKAKKRSTELAMIAAAANAEDGKKKKKAAREAFKKDADSQANEKLVDQGFCRPRVLILCPFRGTAMKIIEGIKEILGENTSMSNKDKFEEEFGAPDSDSEDDSDDDDERDPKTAAGKSKSKSKKRKEGREKPEDWNALFKDSNMDDDFKLGIQINPGQGKGTGSARGAYLRMYCDFFQSDIIIASPLGLRLLIEKNNKPQGKGKEQLNSDFLSSLELIFLHQSDVLYMQNWEHVEFIMSRTNKLAENDHGTDFSRVRPYFLEGKGVEHRQLIVTTHFNEPTIQSAFRTHGQSRAGCIRVKKNWGEGCISQVINNVRQVFQLIKTPDFASQEESRFQYFKESVLTQVLRLEQAHTLIVTPSYLSFVRIRNELLRREANAAYVCEYSRDSEISRGRSKFFHGKTDLMLFSGRAHFFRRFALRGAQHVIFYSLPEYAHFYPEIVNTLGDIDGGGISSNISCLVLFTQYERMALERLVGPKRCEHILSSAKSTFMFQ